MKAKGLVVLLLLPLYALSTYSYNEYSISTQDGLTLHINASNPSMQWLTIDGMPISQEKYPAGFMVLDANLIENISNATINDFYSFEGSIDKNNNTITQQAYISSLDLYLEAKYTAYSNYIKIEGNISSSEEKSIILAYSIPFDAVGGIWWEDIRNYKIIEEDKIYRGNIFYSPHFNKYVLRYNEYPFSAINKDDIGLAFAIRLDEPTLFRIEYDSNASRYYITFDFGLAPYANKSKANFSFIIYRINEWGFRHAAARYYDLYPKFFERRADKYGNCAPHVHFMKCWKNKSKMEDFHFAYDLPFPSYFKNHSVKKLVNINSYLGIDTLVFAIGGMSYALRMKREEFEQYFERGQRKILSKGDVYNASMIFQQRLRSKEENISEQEKRWNCTIISANATRIYNNGCGYYEGDGDAVIIPEDVSYFTGLQVYVNLDPDLPDRDDDHNYTNQAHMILFYRDDFGLRFNDTRVGAITFLERWEEKNVSIKGIVADYLFRVGEVKIKGRDILYNHNKEHFKYADMPLTFDFRNKKPAIYNPFSFLEFINYTQQELQDREKLLAGGDVSSANLFFFPYIDILTTEIGKPTAYNALSDEYANSFRILAYHKPFYIFYNRQGSSYKTMSSEEVEYYIQNCLFYGLYPSFHCSHYGNLSDPKTDSYWANKSLYERDRHLWAFYMPIIISLDKAGWEPITYAKVNNSNVYVERFGGNETLYFTLRNSVNKSQRFSLTIYADELGIKEKSTIKELIFNKSIAYKIQDGKIIINDTIEGNTTLVYKFEPYTEIVFEDTTLIENESVGTNFTIETFASTFNYKGKFVDFTNASWSIANYGSNASIDKSYGRQIKFNTGWRDGIVVLKASDGKSNDSVTFEINSSLFSIFMHRGWNFITLPCFNNYNASLLYSIIKNCQMILRWNASSQQFEIYIPSSPFNFDIEDGIGYFIAVSSASIFSMEDAPINNVSILLYEGWNFLGNFKNETYASFLFNSINGSIILLKWNASLQNFMLYVPNAPDFIIKRGEGFMIAVNKPSIWHG